MLGVVLLRVLVLAATVVKTPAQTRAQAFLARVQENNSAGPVAARARKLRVGGDILGRSAHFLTSKRPSV